MVIQTIHFNTKLEEILSAHLDGQESLTCLRLLHIRHSFDSFSRSMEPARKTVTATLSLSYHHSFEGGSEQEMKDLKSLLFLSRKPWQHGMAASHGMTKANIKSNPLILHFRPKHFIFSLLECGKTTDWRAIYQRRLRK